jgi:hypothetical protein
VKEKLFLTLSDSKNSVYYITIFNLNGRALMMLPQPEMQKGIDISLLAKGTYLLQLMDKETKSISIHKFIKE